MFNGNFNNNTFIPSAFFEIISSTTDLEETIHLILTDSEHSKDGFIKQHRQHFLRAVALMMEYNFDTTSEASITMRRLHNHDSENSRLLLRYLTEYLENLNLFNFDKEVIGSFPPRPMLRRADEEKIISICRQNGIDSVSVLLQNIMSGLNRPLATP
ncbi:MAG: hypothetical protein P8L77_01550 [Gammaproteobacteria bacterium]|nr:hypothetical protein [Gammaproteobacteria bacterium]